MKLPTVQKVRAMLKEAKAEGDKAAALLETHRELVDEAAEAMAGRVRA